MSVDGQPVPHGSALCGSASCIQGSMSACGFCRRVESGFGLLHLEGTACDDHALVVVLSSWVMCLVLTNMNYGACMSGLSDTSTPFTLYHLSKII